MRELPPVIHLAVKDICNIDKLNRKEKFLLVKAMTGYALNVIDFNKPKNQENVHYLLKNFMSNDEIHEVRKKCGSNFDIAVRLKHVIYRCIELDVDIEKNKKFIKRKFIRAGLTKRDAKILFYLDKMNLLTRVEYKSQEAVGNFLHPETVTVNFSNLIMSKEMNDYCMKFINKKLIFIVRSFEVDKDDILHEFRVKAAETYYKRIPFVSEEHAKNSIKQAIHNVGMNLINYYTAKKRQRLEKTRDDEFQSKIHSTNIYVGENDSEYEDFIENTECNDLRSTYVIFYGKSKRKQRRLFRLLIKDSKLLEDISNYMKDETIKDEKEETRFIKWNNDLYKQNFYYIDDLYNKIGKESFIMRVCEYLKINRKEFDNFVEYL